MPIFESQGKRYDIPQDKVELFLNKRADAKFISVAPSSSESEEKPSGQPQNAPVSSPSPVSTPRESNIKKQTAQSPVENKGTAVLPVNIQQSPISVQNNNTPAKQLPNQYKGMSEQQLNNIEHQRMLNYEKKNGVGTYKAAMKYPPLTGVEPVKMDKMNASRRKSFADSEKDALNNTELTPQDRLSARMQGYMQGAGKSPESYTNQGRDISEDDIKNLPPEARAWLDANKIDKGSTYIAPSTAGAAMVSQGAKNTPEQLAMVKDYYTNSQQGKQDLAQWKSANESMINSMRALREQIATLENKRADTWRKSSANNASNTNVSGVIGSQGENISPITYKADALDIAKQELAEQENLYNQIQDKGVSSFSQLGKQIARDALGTVTDAASLGMVPLSMSANKATYIKELNDRIKKGNVTEEDKVAMKALANNAQYQQANAGRGTIAQDVASGIMQSVPYMAGFGALGGTAELATKGLVNTARRGLIDTTEKGIVRQIGRWGINQADAIARGSIITALSPNTYKTAIDLMSGTPDFKEEADGTVSYTGQRDNLGLGGALGKSFMQNVIENTTEFSGEGMSAGWDAIKGNFNKYMPEAVKGLFGNKKMFFTGVTNVMKKTGFQGAPFEYLEEVQGNILHAMFNDGQGTWADVTDPRQNLVTALTVTGIGSGFALANTVGERAYKYNVNKTFDSANKDYDNAFKDNDVYSKIKEGILTGTPEQKQDLFKATMLNPLLTDAQKVAVTNLYRTSIRKEAYDSAKQENVQKAGEQAATTVQNHINPDMNGVSSISITGIESPFIHTGGTIVKNEDGTIDRQNSSPEQYYVDESGNKQVVPTEFVSDQPEYIPAEQAIDQAVSQTTQQVSRNYANDEVRPYSEGEVVRVNFGDTQLIGEITGQDESGNYIITEATTGQQIPVEPMQIVNEDNLRGVENGTLVEYNDPSTGTVKQGIVATNIDLYSRGLIHIQNGDGKTGQEVSIKDVIGPVSNNMSENSIQNEGGPVNQVRQNDSNITQEASSTSESEQPSMSDSTKLPLTKEGYIDYDQITDPKLYLQALTTEFGSDVPEIVDAKVQEANENLQKALSEKDIIKRKRSEKQAKEQVSFWNAISELMNPKEQAIAPEESTPIVEDQPETQPEIKQEEQPVESPEQNNPVPSQPDTNLEQKPIDEYKIPIDGVHIIDYSEKSIAAYGDTSPYKDSLKELGGKFNKKLRVGAGWVFPTNKAKDVVGFFRNINKEDVVYPNQTPTIPIEDARIDEQNNINDEIEAQSPNVDPSEAQKKAGNYKMAHISISGMDISVENPAGSVRSGTDEDGKAWEHEMKSHYGYFNRTEGKDGDHIDVFIKQGTADNWDGTVFVIDQVNPTTGTFDESKIMLGYDTAEEAKQAYLENYDADWNGFSAITPVDLDGFKKWLYDSAKQRKPFSEYVDTPSPVITDDKAPNQDNVTNEVVPIDGWEDNLFKARKYAKDLIADNLLQKSKELDEVWTDKYKLVSFIKDSLNNNKQELSSPIYGESNSLVSKDRYEELKKQMRSKLSNLNMGFDPEVFTIGTQMAMYHIEAGARKFSEFAGKMIEDLGNDVIPYLKSFYEGARQAPGMEQLRENMDSFDTTNSFDLNNLTTFENKKVSNETNPDNRSDNSAPENGGLSSGTPSSDVRERTDESKTDSGGKSEQRPAVETSSTPERGRSGRSKRDNAEPSGTELHSGESSSGRDNGRPDKRYSGESSSTLNQNNNRQERGDNVVPKGNAAKISANIAAIKLAKKLTESGSKATPEQMDILRKYTGWGGLSSVFQQNDKNYNLLQDLLTDEEYNSARASTTTAFYTPPEITSSVWDMLEKLGFKGGNILEPSAGIGNFFALMPKSISNVSNLRGIELDTVSGSILKLLYPDADISISGFEKQRIPNNSVDLVVSNVPFGNFKVYDSNNKDISKFDIHDFFIAKSIRALKAGGIGVFITTSSTLDKSTALRNWVINNGNSDFIDAIRLNTDTFKNSSGTEATSDIVIIRKRDVNGISPYSKVMQDSVVAREATYTQDVKDKWGNFAGEEEKKARMIYNKFFIDFPERLSGEMKFGFEGGNEIRPTEQRLAPVEGIDQNQAIKKMIDSLPSDIYNPVPANKTSKKVANNGTKEGGLTLIDGNPYIIQYNTAIPVEWNSNKSNGYAKSEVLSDYLSLKSSVETLLNAENSEDNEPVYIEKLRNELNKKYDDFSKKYGPLNNNKKISFLNDDIDFPSISAIENVEDGKDGVAISKSDIFSKRVVGNQIKPKADNVIDAVRISLNQNGKVDIQYIAKLLDKKSEDVQSEIISKRIGFLNPETGLINSRDEYLSGNVRSKLTIAQDANRDSEYDTNIEELSKVIPVDIPINLIKMTLGSTWLPSKVYDQWFKEALNVDASITKTSSDKFLAKLSGKNNPLDIQKGLPKASASLLALNAMNNTGTTITMTTWKDGRRVTVKDPIATAQALTKQTELSEEFEAWVKQKKDLHEEIENLYNNTFNSIVNQKVEVNSFDRFPGTGGKVVSIDNLILDNGKEIKRFRLAKENTKDDDNNAIDIAKKLGISYDSNEKVFSTDSNEKASEFSKEANGTSKILRAHQKAGVIRSLQGATLLAHEVGTGKTLTLITTAMEMRRLGLAKKPCIVVQRSTYKQFVKEIKNQYPNANVLAPSSKDLTAKQRQQLFAKIAYNDWDIVVLYHSYLDSIPDDPVRISQFIDKKIEEKMNLVNEMEAAKENGSPNAGRMLGSLKKEIQQLEAEKESALNPNLENGKSAGTKKRSIKDIEKVRSNETSKAEQIMDRRTDNTMTFEQLGIDALLIDEAHAYKKLGFVTSLQKVKGIDTSASKRSQSTKLKSSYILDNHNGKNVVFATGTPISNTMAEMWTFLRYLLPESEISRLQMSNFDSFVNNFGSIEESAEFGTNGKFKVTNRFSSYSNIPELISIWRQIAHTVLTEEVSTLREGVGTPILEGGKPEDIMIEQTPPLKSVMKAIKNKLEEFENMSGADKKAFSYIPLVMFGLAKRAAIDVRLVDPNLPDHPDSKTNVAIREIIKDLKATKDYNGTIAVFCDGYQSSDKVFNIFDEIKQKLIDNGIPSEQIAIINDYKKDEAKENLFKMVNSGQVRVVMGTTEKLGVGVNIQERLHKLIHMDAPLRPSDYQQRNGRIARQGNKHLEMDKPISITRIGVQKTLDVTGYQRLEIKKKFIDQIMKGDVSQRMLEEADIESTDSANFNQMMANLSGSQAALALSIEQNKLKKLINAKQAHEDNQIYMAGAVKRARGIVVGNGQAIERYNKYSNYLKELFPEGKITEVSIGKVSASTPEDIEQMLTKYITKKINAEVEALREDFLRQSSTVESSLSVNGIKINIKSEILRSYDIEGKKSRITRNISYITPNNTIVNPHTGTIAPLFEGHAGANIQNMIDAIDDLLSGYDIEKEIKKYQIGVDKANRDIEAYEPQIGADFSKEKELESTQKRVDELTVKMQDELKQIEEEESRDNVEAINIDNIVSDSIDDSDDDPTTPGGGTRMQSNKEPFKSISAKKFNGLIDRLSKTGLAVDVVIDESEMRKYLEENFGKQNADRFLIYYARMSNNIQSDIKRGWSSIDMGGGYHFNGTFSELKDMYDRKIEKSFDKGELYIINREGDLNKDEIEYYNQEFNNNEFSKEDIEDGTAFDSINQLYIDLVTDPRISLMTADDMSIAELDRAFDNDLVREIYPGAWTIVDDRFDGSIAGIQLKSENLDDAVNEAKNKFYSGKFDADGYPIDVNSSELVYSDNDFNTFSKGLHIFRLMSTPSGEVYGFTTPDGRIFIDPNKLNANTPIHEFGHLWNSWIKENNQKLWDKGKQLVLNSPYYWDKVQSNPNYSRLNEDQKVDEALAMAIGDKGELFYNRSFKQKFIDWLKDLWDSIKNSFGLNSSVEVDNMTLEDFSDNAVKELLNNKELSSSTVENSNVKFQVNNEPNPERDIASRELDRRLNKSISKIREGWEDRYLPVKEFETTLRKLGVDIEEYNDYYLQATHLNGKNDEQLKYFDKKYFEPLERTIGEFLNNFDMRDLENYAILKHGIERNETMRSEAVKNYIDSHPEANQDDIDKFTYNQESRDYSGVTAVEEEVRMSANEYIDHFEERAGEELIDKFWNQVNSATKFSLKKQLDGGIIDKKVYNEVSSRWKYYIPLRGHDETTAEDRWDYSPDMGTYFVAPLIKAKGRKSRAEFPFSYIRQSAQSAINSANRNLLNQTLLRLSRKDTKGVMGVNKAWYVKAGLDNDGNQLWEVQEPAYSEDPEVQRQNIEDFNERMATLAEEGEATQKSSKLKIGMFIKPRQAKQHSITVYENGIEYHVFINANPRVSRAVNQQNLENIDSGIFGKITREMAANFTMRNPMFVASNLTRDYIFASSMLGVKEDAAYLLKFQKNLKNSGDALQRYLRGKSDLTKAQDRHLMDYILNGAKTGFSHLIEIKKTQKQIEKDISRGGKDTALRTVLNWLEAGNEFAENITRLSTFITSREEGRSIAQSVNDAKNVTVNFNQSGSGAMGAKYFKPLYLFLNAGIQALSNFMKIAWNNKFDTAIMLGGYASIGILTPLLTMLLGGDDGLDDYMKLSDWERQNNLCLYTGNGFIKIPLPQELRVFYAIGDRVFMILSGGKDLSDSLKETVLGFADLIPINPTKAFEASWAELAPDAVKPFAQLATNTNFMGTQIYDKWADENKPGYLKARTNKKGESYAPSFLVKLSQLLDNTTGGDGTKKGLISPNPDVIQHIVRGYFGGMYNMGMQGLDLASKTYDLAFTDKGFKLKVRETPLKTFFTSSDDLQTSQSGLNTRYYDVSNEVKEIRRQVKDYQNRAEKGDLTIEQYGKKISDMEKDINYMQRAYPLIHNIKILETNMKDMDENRQKQVEKIVSDLKKQVILINK